MLWEYTLWIGWLLGCVGAFALVFFLLFVLLTRLDPKLQGLSGDKGQELADDAEIVGKAFVCVVITLVLFLFDYLILTIWGEGLLFWYGSWPIPGFQFLNPSLW